MLLCAADASGFQPKMVFFNTTIVPGEKPLFVMLLWSVLMHVWY
jgi:hypothetical protein